MRNWGEVILNLWPEWAKQTQSQILEIKQGQPCLVLELETTREV